MPASLVSSLAIISRASLCCQLRMVTGLKPNHLDLDQNARFAWPLPCVILTRELCVRSSPSISQRVEVATRLTDKMRSARPPFPRSAKIELVPRCDLDCFFCASHKHPRTAADMSQESFQRIAVQLRRLGVEELGLFYIGESFLCDWLPDAVRYAKDVCRFPYVFLTT